MIMLEIFLVPLYKLTIFLSLHSPVCHKLMLRVMCILQEDDDLPYEEEIIRNPYSVKCWMRYIEHKQNAQKSVLNMIYERALKELPGRYIHVILFSLILNLCA